MSATYLSTKKHGQIESYTYEIVEAQCRCHRKLMGDKAIRREHFKVHFVVDNIATVFTNKYEGTASDLLSSPLSRSRARARAKRKIGVIERRDDVRLKKHRMLRYSPSSGDPRIQSTE